MEMKYIILRLTKPGYPQTDDDELVPVVFPKSVSHGHMARIHRAGDTRFIRGAFCEVHNGKVTVRGQSETTDTESAPEDAALIQKYFEGFTVPALSDTDKQLAWLADFERILVRRTALTMVDTGLAVTDVINQYYSRFSPLEAVDSYMIQYDITDVTRKW